MTSTRLPGKVMLPLAGEPVIRHVLRRCKAIPGIDHVIAAIPDHGASKPLAQEIMAQAVPVYFGPEHDVLARYRFAALSVKADVVMRVTADCPLLDPAVAGAVLRPVVEGRADYASNVIPRGFPQGLDCEAFTFAALDAAYHATTEPYDREHVTPWLQRNTELRRVSLAGMGPAVARLRWTLDTEEDYRFLSTIFDRLPSTSTDFRHVLELVT